MTIEEFEIKAQEWNKSIEEILIEITLLKDAKGLSFHTDLLPCIEVFSNGINKARTAIKASEISIKVESNNE